MTSLNKNSQLYRRCVGVALFNDKGQVFVGERIDTPNAWQMPQGGIEQGETVEEAFIRELKEEIGTNDVQILEVASKTTSYDFPPALRKKLWDGQYAGQNQSWVAAKFLGKDNDINLNAYTEPEFGAWKWVSLDELLEYIVPFKRDTYKQVISFFKHYS